MRTHANTFTHSSTCAHSARGFATIGKPGRLNPFKLGMTATVKKSKPKGDLASQQISLAFRSQLLRGSSKNSLGEPPADVANEQDLNCELPARRSHRPPLPTPLGSRRSFGRAAGEAKADSSKIFAPLPSGGHAENASDCSCRKLSIAVRGNKILTAQSRPKQQSFKVKHFTWHLRSIETRFGMKSGVSYCLMAPTTTAHPSLGAKNFTRRAAQVAN